MAETGIHFFYDFYPIMVEYSERKTSFLQFVTSVAAIVGGIFTVSRSAADTNPPAHTTTHALRPCSHRSSVEREGARPLINTVYLSLPPMLPCDVHPASWTRASTSRPGSSRSRHKQQQQSGLLHVQGAPAQYLPTYTSGSSTVSLAGSAAAATTFMTGERDSRRQPQKQQHPRRAERTRSLSSPILFLLGLMATCICEACFPASATRSLLVPCCCCSSCSLRASCT